LQESVPNRALQSLQELRLKLTEIDSVVESLQMLLAPLKELIPKNEGQLIKGIQGSYPNTLTPIAYYPLEHKPQTVNAIEMPRL
jgi:hypothetical protein